MTWLLIIAFLVFVALPRLLRRRRGSIPMLPSQPINTFHNARLKRTNGLTKAALDAASALLN